MASSGTFGNAFVDDGSMVSDRNCVNEFIAYSEGIVCFKKLTSKFTEAVNISFRRSLVQILANALQSRLRFFVVFLSFFRQNPE